MPTPDRRRLLLETLAGSDAFVRVEPVLAATYTDLTGEVWRALLATQAPDHLEPGSPPPAPKLEVVHSILSRPMSSRDGDQWFLTYDQHLGQILSQLTKLVLTDASPAAADSYLRKLFAQRLYVAGQFTASLAMLVRSHQSRELPVESSGQAEARDRTLLAQEAFVIGHELTHVLFRQVDVRDELAQEVLGLLEDVRADERPGPQEFETQWEQSLHDLAARYGISPAEIPQLNPSEIEDRVGDRLDTALRESPELLEECICDYAGSIAAALSGLSRRGASLEESFVASSMALHHLRLLQLLDNYANQEAPERLFTDSVIRLSAHRRLIVAFSSSVGEEWEARPMPIHEQTVAYNVAFSRVIGDPALFAMGFDSYLEEVQTAELATGADSSAWDRQQRLWLRKELGFDPQWTRVTTEPQT